MAILTVGWDGTGPDNTESLPVTNPRGVKVPVGSAAGLVVYKGHVMMDTTSAAAFTRVLVYDDDGSGGIAGTFLGAGWLGYPAGAGTFDLYFPEGVTLPASGSVWLYFIGTGAGGGVFERDTATVSTECRDISAGAGYTTEGDSPTQGAPNANRDVAVWLEADTDQPYTRFVGDDTAPGGANTTPVTHLLALSRFPVTAADKARTYSRIAWNRANDAFPVAKVRLCVYADDGTGDAGAVITSLEEASLGSNPSANGGWVFLTPTAFNLASCTDFVFVGWETDGGASISYMAYSSGSVVRGWRYSTGLAAWSDAGPPADLSAIAPHTSGDLATYTSMAFLLSEGDPASGGTPSPLVADAFEWGWS